MPAVASQKTLESSSAIPPHHTTVKGHQQPFLISIITPEGESPDRSYSYVWKVRFRRRQILTLKKHRHHLIDFCFLPQIQSALISFQNLLNNIHSNLQLAVNHAPSLSCSKAQAPRQTSSVCYSA